MSKEVAICEHCCAKMVEYTFSFNKGLAVFLGKLFDAQGPVKTDNLGLTYAQRTNSQKLRYWGLAEPYVNEESTIKRGWWQITYTGKLFVLGQTTIKKQVVMYRNKVIRYEGVDLFFDKVSDGYKYHEDYAKQVRSQIYNQTEMF